MRPVSGKRGGGWKNLRLSVSKGGGGRGISEEYARGPGKLRGQGFRVYRIMKALRWNNKIRGKVEIKLYLCVSRARRKVRKGRQRGFRGKFFLFLF